MTAPLAYPEVHGADCECGATDACAARAAFLTRVLGAAHACAGCAAPIPADIAERLARRAYYPYPEAPAFRCPGCQTTHAT